MSALSLLGNEFRTSRLDPHASKCSRRGHVSGMVSWTPHGWETRQG
jgi:hypothetical protein